MIGREPKPMLADYDRAVREHLIDLAYSGERLAGLVEMIPHRDHLLIQNVAVSPDQQGRGIGKQLMSHAEAVAAQLRLPLARLYTNRLFEMNIRLYGSLGYRIEREEAFRGGVLVHMSKVLAG